jgi:hypothetical protein
MRLVRRSVASLLVAMFFTLGLGCAKAPPNLSPADTKIYTADQVVVRVNRLMETAISAEAQGLPRNTVRRIVTFCVEADQTLAAVPDGWGPTVWRAWSLAKDDPDLKPYLQNIYISAMASLVDVALAYYAPKLAPQALFDPARWFLVPPTFSLEVS